MEETVLEKRRATADDARIARRLEETLRATREDEARILGIIRFRRLKRRAKKSSRSS